MFLLHVVFSYIVYYTNAATYTVTITSGTERRQSAGTGKLTFELCDYKGKCTSPISKTDGNKQFVGVYSLDIHGNLKTLNHARLTGDKTDGYDLAKFEVKSGGRTYTRIYDPPRIVYDRNPPIDLRKCSNQKYGPTKWDCKPCHCDKNAECHPDNGACDDICAAGYRGAACQVECNDGNHGLLCQDNCSTNCENVCNKRNGHCDCKPGHYGEDCSLPCKPGYYGYYCKTECKTCKGGCDKANGVCIGGCIPGYINDKCGQCKGHLHGDSCLPCDNGTFGDVCQHNCSVHCANVCDTRNGSCACKLGYTSRNCFQRCASDRFGHYCQDKCDTCAHGCDNVDGTCNGSCIIGYIGRKCGPCKGSHYGVNCTQDCNCFKNYACNFSTGNCGRYGCGVGWTGDSTCHAKIACGNHKWGKTCIDCGGCRQNCTLNHPTCHQRCDRDSGVCSSQCMDNFLGSRCDVCTEAMYGRKCDKYCGKCALSCHTVTGQCHHHTCQPGVLGVKCDILCDDGFSGISCSDKIDTCEEESCEDPISCPSNGYFGPKCNFICFNCLDLSCYKDGACKYGCIYGYGGVACQRACISGTYGRNCEEFCGRCIGWAECDMITGQCADGCLGHFVSPMCTVCPVGYFGPVCGERCGHCKDFKQCDIFTGICHNGCALGFNGHHCDIRDEVPEELDPALDL